MAVRHNHGGTPARASTVEPEIDAHVASGPELVEAHAPGRAFAFLPVHRGGRIANHISPRTEGHATHAHLAGSALTLRPIRGSLEQGSAT